MNQPPSDQPSGLPHAIGAYLIWGLFPVYLLLVRDVPAIEFVGWRVLGTGAVSLAIIVFLGQIGELRLALGNPRTLLWFALSTLFISANWLIYFLAIQSGHVFATSLGYYINPLVNVLAGTLFLGEKLSKRQWLAVALAAAGVALLAWEAREMLGIALGLAVTFCAYGLVRRLAPAGALIGLAGESLIMLVPALAILGWYAASPAGTSLGKATISDIGLATTGFVSTFALVLFATAARRMAYSALGFVQYLAPTIVFLLGLFVFHEPLRPVQLACFVTIWTAIAIYTWDLVAQRRRATA